MAACARTPRRRFGLGLGALLLIAAAAVPAGADPAPNTITSVVPADGLDGVAYSHSFTGTPAGATWAVTGGTLPTGLSLDADTGELAGTPTTAGSSGSITVDATWATARTPAVVATGNSVTCAVLDDAALQCWGLNNAGQLGLADTTTRGDEPGEMGDALPAVDLGIGRTASAVSIGDAHTCALLDDGAVKCWGANADGQLGLGDTATRGDGPGEMGDALPAVDLGTGRTATAIAVSYRHTCALLDDASVKCWGYNNGGQLGLGNTATRGDGPGEMGDALPAINLGTGRTATAITATVLSTCALLDDASVKCWGYNGYGQLGQGDTAHRGDGPGEMGDALPAINLGTGRTATAIEGGSFHTCAVLDDASLKCWGSNFYGEVGQGDTVHRGDGPGEMGDALPAINLGTGRTATATATGTYHTCALLDDASVKCWGYNIGGQLGLGDTATRGDEPGEMGDSLPAIDLGTGRTATATATGAGAYSTCAMLDDATLKCWGGNGLGQLGHGDSANRGDVPGEMGDALPAVDLGSTPIGTDTQTFTITIDPVTPGTVSGTVVEDGTGNPLAGISVRLLDATTGTLLAVQATDLAGSYAFTDVAPDDYLVRFIDMNGSHVPEFHADTATKAAATPVTLANGGTTDVDASLLPAGTGTIAGTVTEQGAATPLPGISVRLLTTGNVLLSNRTTSGTGTYSFGLRDHGSYMLRFIDPDASHIGEFHLDAATRSTATVVDHSAWITTIDAGLTPAG